MEQAFKKRLIKYDILNRPPPDSIPDIEETNEDLNINCGRISKEETKRAIKKLKLGKAPGIDNIPSDVLKADIGATTNVLYSGIKRKYQLNGRQVC